MKHFVALCFFAATVAPYIARAATINAASASQANVETAIAAASAGDTVQVPAGSASWSGLSIAKAIHLQGAGVGVTNITLTGNNAVTKQAAGITTISDFSFSKTGGGNESKGWTFGGAWTGTEPIIFRDNAVTQSSTGFIKINTPGGVIISGNSFTAGNDDSIIQPKNAGDSYGSWRTNSSMGAADTTGKLNIYVEGNTFYGGTNQGIDADDAARVVFRYNTCTYFSFNSHGLDTSEDGVRHFEVYENTFIHSGGTDALANQNWVFWIRGGSGVIFNNVIPNVAGAYWGDKSEAKFDIRAQQDNSGVAYGTTSPPTARYSAGQGTYPRERQLGQSWSETGSNAYGINGGVGEYVTDPIYVWGNTGTGASGGAFLAWQDGGSWGSHAGYFESGRDYVFGSTAKPGYTAYTYPHPLRDDATAPTAPNTATLAAYRNLGGTIAWTDASDNETGVKIERSTDNTNWTLIGTTSANATTYTDRTAFAGTTYYYRVRATNGAGDSDNVTPTPASITTAAPAPVYRGRSGTPGGGF